MVSGIMYIFKGYSILRAEAEVTVSDHLNSKLPSSCEQVAKSQVTMQF